MTEDGKTDSFIDKILDGLKKGETREHNKLKRGWVGLAKDGKVYGRVKLGAPKWITKASPEYADAMIAGTDYDINGEGKWYYPIEDMENFRSAPRDAADEVRKMGDGRFSTSSTEAIASIVNGEKFGVIKNSQYGDIQYHHGRLGKHGMGLAHIVESRMAKDDDTLEGAIDIAIRVAYSAEMGEVTDERYSTKHFDLNGVRAIVAFNNDGNKVITGYEISAGDLGGANRRARKSLSQPHVSLDEIVAALKSKLAEMSTGDIVPQSSNGRNSLATPAEDAAYADAVGGWGLTPLVGLSVVGFVPI